MSSRLLSRDSPIIRIARKAGEGAVSELLNHSPSATLKGHPPLPSAGDLS